MSSATPVAGMTGAKCLFCLRKDKGLPTGHGKYHEPWGVCRMCHSLACGYHGQRDDGSREFLCIKCAISKVAASSLAWPESDQKIPDLLERIPNLFELIPILTGYRPPFGLVPQNALDYANFDTLYGWRYTTVEDWMRRYQGLDNDLGSTSTRAISVILDYSWRHERLRDIFRTMPQESKRLVAAASVIASRLSFVDDQLELPPEWWPLLLQDPVAAVNISSGRFH